MGRRIIVHHVGHADAAMAAAESLDTDVVLLSPPGAAQSLGALVFRHMIATAAARRPGARFDAVLDCGPDPGLALNAMRHGVPKVRVEASAEVRRRLADIARGSGAALDTGGGKALDLEDAADPIAACRAWLEKA